MMFMYKWMWRESKVCVLCVQPPQQFYTLHSAACAGVWRSIKDTQIQNSTTRGGAAFALSNARFRALNPFVLALLQTPSFLLLLLRCVLII